MRTLVEGFTKQLQEALSIAGSAVLTKKKQHSKYCCYRPWRLRDQRHYFIGADPGRMSCSSDRE